MGELFFLIIIFKVDIQMKLGTRTQSGNKIVLFFFFLLVHVTLQATDF